MLTSLNGGCLHFIVISDLCSAAGCSFSPAGVTKRRRE